ncbi:DUF362 domain-containing protein [Candidatus Latescibacterota bacterium]
MNTEKLSKTFVAGRRDFLKQFSVGTAGLALGTLGLSGCASNVSNMQTHRRQIIKPESSRVSFVANTDQREAAFQALKPLESEVERAIGEKTVMIKINSGQVSEDLWLNATDPKFVAGILDFLKPIHGKQVIIAESTAASTTTMEGFENYGFMPLAKEFNIKFVDLNDDTFTTKWILTEQHHPLAINIIDSLIDPDIYLISATRLKTHNNVIATLSLKNVAMASPVNHYKQKARTSANGVPRNEKPLMHSGGNRGLSYNLFRIAREGVQPDLAVLDGVVGMEGDGPVRGTPVEQGVALASTDWVAADRLGVELMGINFDEVKYIQWCSDSGMGNDDLSKITVMGPNFKQHIQTYKLHRNIESQREWVLEDFKA